MARLGREEFRRQLPIHDHPEDPNLLNAFAELLKVCWFFDKSVNT
jgi:hypothetical protein